MLSDVEGVILQYKLDAVMNCNIVLVGLKAGHPSTFLIYSEVCTSPFRVSVDLISWLCFDEVYFGKNMFT